MTDLAQAAAWHRQVAALATAADRVGVATAELPGVRARLLTQQARFAQTAAQRGVPLPALVPTPDEIASATPALGDLSPAAVSQALRTIGSTLDAADLALGLPIVAAVPVGTPASAGPQQTEAAPDREDLGEAPATIEAPAPIPAWPIGVRNGVIYAGYASSVLIIQVLLMVVVSEESLPLFAPLCLVILPAFAWAAGWLTIGVAYRPAPDEPAVNRTPRVGAIIAASPNLILCGWLGVLFVAG